MRAPDQTPYHFLAIIHPSPTIRSVPQTLPNPQAQVHATPRSSATSRSFGAPAPLRLWHLTSLDAPTVAVVWTLAFAWAAGIRLPAWIPGLLALTAWAVYIADRLLDARAAMARGDLGSLRERHLFHHRHRRLLIPVAALAASAAACIVFTLMPAPARERNSLLACAALLYFTTVHSESVPSTGNRLSFSSARLFRKELLVGVLFTAACALPTLSRVWIAHLTASFPLLAAALIFSLLAWLNCHAIDRWEDARSKVCAGRHKGIARPACLLASAASVLAVSMASSQPRLAALLAAAAASSLLLALLDQLRPQLTPLALRALADLVLLTPLILLVPAALRP